ncbi:uncharacterized protein haspin [Genypterus blacodes]|uniref:uncharacterized protein haspin n=1 Tax=Genypterus blacodes TaxID=154954 RepID=UPI003F76893F
MSDMKPAKPLFMKTYGKQKRKLSAWIPPDNRKKAFESSASSASDVSVFEPPKRSKVSIRKKVTNVRAVRRAKTKALACLVDKDSDEENISTGPAERSTAASGNVPSVGRFVTRRRRPVASKPKHPQAADVCNSSDDFIRSTAAARPARRKNLSALKLSSAENSVDACPEAVSFAKPFREILLNESAEQSLCSRKPLFCSTPSLKHSSITHQLSTSQSISVSCIAPPKTFHEDLDSPGQASTSPSPSPVGLSSGGKQAGHSEDHVFVKPMSGNNRSCSSEGHRSRSETAESRHEDASVCVRQPSVLSIDSDGSSQFMSASGGSEWLTETQEERLTRSCPVQLQRADTLLSQLSDQTPYSSCLENSGSADEHAGGRIKERLEFTEPSLNMHLSVTCNEADSPLQSTNHTPSSPEAQNTHPSPAPPLCSDHSASVITIDSTHHADSSVCFLSDSPSAAINSRLPDPGPEELTVPTKEAPAVRSCTVALRRLPLSQLRAFTQQKLCSGSAGVEGQKSTGTEQRGTAGPAGHRAALAPDERTDAVAETLRENCLTAKCTVVVKRLSPAQWKPRDDPPVKTQKRRRASSRRADGKKSRLLSSDTENSGDNQPKRNKPLPPKEKKRRSASADRSSTARKVCVSGLSVSRWKHGRANASTLAFPGRAAPASDAVDCSINALIPTQHKRAKFSGPSSDLSSPVRAGRLDLSCLLLELTPNTHTWSRLKAALSVHRKVLLTPRSVCRSVSGSPRRVALADMSWDLFTTPLRTPLPKRLQSQLLNTASGVVFEDADLSDAEKVYAECSQQAPLAWEECVLPQRMKQCVKIGEGTFGEVFSTTNASGDTVALKVIPVEGSEQVNGEEQKTFGEILHEIIISKELSSLKEKQQNQTHGFIGLNDLHCVRGGYPPSFLQAWDAFDQRKGSENDRPDFFLKEQVFIILEFEFGGVDLENSNGTLSSLLVAKSVLHQVTAALAVAEQELQFEHRDLHWGNVLVRATKQKKGSFLLNGAAHCVETKGVHVSIIDYSLSRLEIDGLTVSCDISRDEELFMGQGDYQFDIYRLMRQENGNDWSSYAPHSNVLWLHYLCSKLLAMKYRGKGGRAAKDVREELTRFYDNILQHGSATEALRNCPMFK